MKTFGSKDSRPKAAVMGTVDAVTPQLQIVRATQLLDPDTWRLHVMIYGSGGTGKSLLLGTLPRPLGFISVGAGELTLANEPDIYVAEIPLWSKEGKRQPKNWKLIDEAIRIFADDERIVSVAIDDLSGLQDHAVQYVLYTNNSLGMAPTQPQWGTAMSMISEAAQYLFATGKHVAMSAHQQFMQEQGTGRGWMLPNVVGKLAFSITNPWDEVWHSQVNDLPDFKDHPRRYRCMTQPNLIYTAKSRMAKHGLIKPFEDFTIEDLSKGIPTDNFGLANIVNRVAKLKKKEESKDANEKAG